MVAHHEVLAIIPARGGSKSLPRKNIRSFAGHPLLAYSIAAALQSESVTRVIVSTDDEEIAEIARSYGAEVPVLRPTELAQDSTLDLPVFEHMIAWLANEEDYHPEMVIQLRPTSPLRPPDCVDRGVTLLRDHPEADSVRGVVPSGQNPYKMWRIDEGGVMQPLLDNGFDEPYNMPRQELPPTYWQTGHIDVIRTTVIMEKHSLSGDTILALVLDPKYSIDIDTERDWQRAEWKLEDAEMEVVRPGPERRRFPEVVELLVLDFDGVLTDNRVWVDAEGRELVAANRGDGWGIARLKEHGTQVVVLSTETNPVVAARCRKLGIPVEQGLAEKGVALKALLERGEYDPARTIYLGNDENDLPCFPLVAFALVVADAHTSAKAAADQVLRRPGGHGAVRELCDLIIQRTKGT